MTTKNNPEHRPESPDLAETNESVSVRQEIKELIRLGVEADIECDYDEARRLWQMAADLGSEDAVAKLNLLVREERERDILAQLDAMTDAESTGEEAKRLWTELLGSEKEAERVLDSLKNANK